MVKRSKRESQERVIKEKFRLERQPVYIKPKTENQKIFWDSLHENTIIIGDGAAGCGKTLLSCYYAAKKLHYNDVKKIVLIRAYQPLAGRSIGLLPGSEEEKLLSTYSQMILYLKDILGSEVVDAHIRNKNIEMCSLETIRGRNWENCIVVVDESQNLFVPEIQALTTRLGDNAKMILVGDGSGFQSDVKKGMNGLTYLKKIVDKYQIKDVASITFGVEDILRSGITKDFVVAYYTEMEKGEPIVKGG